MPRHHVRFGPRVHPQSPSELARLLRRLARAALAGGVAVSSASACSGHRDGNAVGGAAGSGSPPGDESLTPVDCSDNRPVILDGVRLPQDVSHLALYREWNANGSFGSLPFAAIGLPLCKIDDASCNQDIASLVAASPACRMAASACRTFAVVKRGDEVMRVEERAQFVELFGEIDRADEALAIAYFDGQQLQCAAMLSRSLAGTRFGQQDGAFVVVTEWEECGVALWRDSVRVESDGSVSETTHDSIGGSACTVGRRPVGYVACAPRVATTQLGGFFANAARLEAASVFAFAQLGRELAALGAPARLRQSVALAVVEEIRHARSIGALARRFGGEASAPQPSPSPPRGALALALDNAVEGCVRETFGALVATHQAAAARDREVRSVMTAVARDETRHAALSWELARWLEPMLSSAERAAVERARSRAVAGLFADLEQGLSPAAAALIGWPEPQLGASLLSALSDSLGL